MRHVLRPSILVVCLLAAACAAHAPAVPTPEETRAVALRAAGVIEQVGLIVEQVQILEIKFADAGRIGQPEHQRVQGLLRDTARSVLQALGVLQRAETWAQAQAALQAVRTTIDAFVADGLRAILDRDVRDQLGVIVSAARAAVDASLALVGGAR